MRLLLLFGVLVTGCGLREQFLVSPCVNMPATNDGGECPACSTDADCYVLTNMCQRNAYCVNRGSNNAVTLEGCTMPYDATRDECHCISHVCKSK